MFNYSDTVFCATAHISMRPRVVGEVVQHMPRSSPGAAGGETVGAADSSSCGAAGKLCDRRRSK